MDERKESRLQTVTQRSRILYDILRFYNTTKTIIISSWINILLAFVPIGIVAEAAHLNPSIVFTMNAIAIIPLDGLLSYATESVAKRMDDTIGAFMNVTFGNAVELIVFIIALVKEEIRIVQASLLGSILANLLLILECLFIGGMRFREQIYNSTVTQMSACLLSLSVMSLLLPTAFHASFISAAAADRAVVKVSRGISIVSTPPYLYSVLLMI
jgi:Ca2+:H+ antiporter